MSKYILIPVKFLEEKLYNDETNLDIESALGDFKQISLDDKDINLLASKKFPMACEESSFSQEHAEYGRIYAQALKDLRDGK